MEDHKIQASLWEFIAGMSGSNLKALAKDGTLRMLLMERFGDHPQIERHCERITKVIEKSPTIDQLVDASIEHMLMKELLSYLNRGRRYRNLSDSELGNAWISAFHAVYHHAKDRSTGLTLRQNFLCASWSLRMPP